MIDSDGVAHFYDYDRSGRLVQDSNSNGDTVILGGRSASDVTQFTVTVSRVAETAAILAQSIDVYHRPGLSDVNRVQTNSVGLQTVITTALDGTRATQIAPNGLVTMTQTTPSTGAGSPTMTRRVAQLGSLPARVTDSCAAFSESTFVGAPCGLTPGPHTRAVSSVTRAARTWSSRLDYVPSASQYLATSTSPGGRSATLVFDDAGRLVERKPTESNEHSTFYHYDVRGRLARVSRSETRTAQAQVGDLVLHYNFDGNDDGFVDAVSIHGGATTMLHRDSLERSVGSTVIPSGQGAESGVRRWTFERDIRGRINRVLVPSQLAYLFSYSSGDDALVVTEPADAGPLVTSFVFDELNRIVRRAAPDGTVAKLDYHACEFSGITFPRNGVCPAGTRDRVTEDLRSIEWRDGLSLARRVEFAYGATGTATAGQLTGVSRSDGESVSFTSTPTLATVSNTGLLTATWQAAFDPTYGVPFAEFAYSSGSGASVWYVTDDDGLVEEIEVTGTPAVPVLDLVRSSASGRIESSTMDEIHSVRAHDQHGRVRLEATFWGAALPVTASTTCANLAIASELIACQELEFALTGEISDEWWYTPAGHTHWGYTYSSGERRLESAIATGDGDGLDGTWFYTWDNNGSPTSVNVLDDAGTPTLALTSAEIDVGVGSELNQYGDREFVHDANGGVVAVVEQRPTEAWTRCIERDVTGELVAVRDRLETGTVPSDPCASITTPSEHVSYTYDVLGRRQSRTSNGQTVAWLYRNALKPIAQFVIDPTTGASLIDQLYIYGSSALTPDALLTYDNAGAVAGVYRIITDARGSVRLVVDAVTGEIEQQLNYGPFGEVLYDSNPGFQPFGYAGGIYDADTGLVRFGARDYDAETGRWLSRDPIGFAGGDANLYAYVGGDPVNGVDPTGLDGVDLSAELEAGLFFARSALAAFSLGPFWSEAEIASDLKTGAFGRRDSMFRDGLIQASRNRIARESMDGMYGALTCADHYLESFEGATDFGAGAMRMRVDGYGWLKWMPFFDPPRSNTDIPPTRRYPETYRAALAGIGDARALGLANPENEYWLAVQTGLGR